MLFILTFFMWTNKKFKLCKADRLNKVIYERIRLWLIFITSVSSLIISTICVVLTSTTNRSYFVLSFCVWETESSTSCPTLLHREKGLTALHVSPLSDQPVLLLSAIWLRLLRLLGKNHANMLMKMPPTFSKQCMIFF